LLLPQRTIRGRRRARNLVYAFFNHREKEKNRVGWIAYYFLPQRKRHVLLTTKNTKEGTKCTELGVLFHYPCYTFHLLTTKGTKEGTKHTELSVYLIPLNIVMEMTAIGESSLLRHEAINAFAI